MKTKLLLLSIFILCIYCNPGNLYSQNSLSYAAASDTTAALLTDNNGNAIDFTTEPNIISNSLTDAKAGPFAIGFDFLFMGKYYSHFIAGNSGQVGLASSGSTTVVMSGTSTNNLLRTVAYPPAASGTAPVLAAFWDYLKTPANGMTVRTKLTGNAPARCRVIQWNALINAYSTTSTDTADGMFQLRIYEGSNIIEYVYGKMTTGSYFPPGTFGQPSASIGFSAGSANNTFLALSNLNTFSFTAVAANEPATQNTASNYLTGAITPLHSTAEGKRRFIRFSPANPLSGAFSSLGFTNVSQYSVKLNWTDNFTNELGFLIYRSTDGINFELAGSTAPDINNYTATGLVSGTNYTWKVTAITEGQTSSIAAAQATNTCSSGLSGIVKIGPNAGDHYTTITAANTALKNNGLGGNTILELQTGYNPAAETYPVSFRSNPSQESFSLTLRPAAGVSPITFTASGSSAFILDSLLNFTIDGSPGGTGNSKGITIQNTSSSGTAIVFRNTASGNVIKNTVIRGNNNSSISGVVLFSTTAFTTGNSNNIIEFCDLREATASPAQLLYAEGTSGKENSGNIIRNCNFFNTSYPITGSTDFSMLNIAGNNTAWVIDGNSFYQPAGMTSFSSYTASFIRVAASTGRRFKIVNNYLGGSAPQCGGTNTLLTFSSAGFHLVNFAGFTGDSSFITGNQLRNFTATQNQQRPNYPSLINITGGIVQCQNNLLGSTTAADAIVLLDDSPGTFSNAPPRFAGIKLAPFNAGVVASQNTIAGIQLKAVAATPNYSSGKLSFYAIAIDNNPLQVTITGNTIGSPAVTNSIYSTNAKTQLQGIFISSGNSSVQYLINNNTIQNIRSYSTDSSCSVYGIQFSAAAALVQKNIIRNLTLTAGNNSYMAGIETNATVSGNTISNLRHESASAANIFVIGINGGALVSENFIHSLTASTSGTATIHGITNPAFNQCRNNMIRLGLDSSGASISRDYTFTGIYGTTCANYLHNTIYIGGQVSNGSNNSSCITLSNSCSPNILLNNIFINYRSGISGSGKHYQVVASFPVTNGSPSNGNIFHDLKTGFNCRYGNTDYTSLLSWVAAVKKDSLSLTGWPNLINATGNAATVNLHVRDTTMAESNGVSSVVTADFDGQTRATNTPVDIGADAGLFSQADISGPFIIPDVAKNHPAGAPQYINTIIRDAGRVDTSATLKPRLWFRKSYPVVSNWYSTAGTRISGTAKYGIWRFQADYPSVGLPINGNDSVQFYIVAQDTLVTPNIGYAPEAGAAHSDVNTQITAPSAPYSYRVIPILSDTIYAGNGQIYNSLTKAGGLFEALNTELVSLQKNVTVLITSDMTEDGSNALTNTGLNGFRLTIKPSADTVRNISNTGNLANSLVTVSGAKRVFFDGSYNSSGRYLRFVNTNTAPFQCKPVFYILGSADSAVFSNIIIESNHRIDYNNSGGPVASVFINTGNNRNIIIRESAIGNAVTGTPGSVEYAILSLSAGNKISITGNDIYNFNAGGVSLQSIADSAIVAGNHFYYNMPSPANNSQTCIKINNGRKHRIENNFIGGSSRNCGGTAWLNNGSLVNPANGTVTFIAIDAQPAATDTTFIRNNTIQNINISAPSGAFSGIDAYGMLVITGNNIGHPSSPNSIINAGDAFSTYTRAMNIGGASPVEVSNNTIANITSTGTGSPVSVALHGIFIGGNGFAKVLNNTVYNLKSSSGSSYLSPNAAVTGIYLWSSLNGYLCEGNTIRSLKAVNTENNTEAIGIRILSSTTGNFNRNRIYDLECLSARGGSVTGIYAESAGSYKFTNNQLALTNGTNTNKITIRGIYNNANNYTGSYYYNSIYIGGTTPDTSWSYGLILSGNIATAKCFNNLIYNERTSGTGGHYAISAILNNQSTNWTSRTSNYNLFVTADTSKVMEWGPCCTGVAQSMRQWRAATAGDSSSYTTLNTKVPSATLFVNTAAGNLNINNSDSLCWYVNGKGMPVTAISGDFDSAANVRSTNPVNGPTDIGADEFNTSTNLVPLELYGNHQPGGADTISFNGRIMAVIKWGSTGTLPVMGNAKWYSGVWPKDTTNNSTVSNARYMSSYLDIPASGGSNYSYSLTMFYDSAMAGKITNPATMLLHKRETGLAGSWVSYPSSVVNTSAKTITVNNINSFSEFTATDANAPLSAGVQSFCPGSNAVLNAQLSGNLYQWQLDNGSGFSNVTDNAVFSGTGTQSLQINNLPSSWYGYKLRCVVDGINTVATTIRIANSWTGTVDSAWENPANWGCGSVPDANTDVVISSGTVVLSSNTVIRSLTLSPGVIFIVNPGVTLTITH